MAQAIAEGARSVPGTEVVLKRVPELVPDEIARKSGMKIDQDAPVASPKELADYDAIIFAPHPLRQHGGADTQPPRPDRRPVGEGRARGQDRQRLRLDRDAARRLGDDHHLLPHHSPPSWHDHRRPALFLSRPDEDGRSVRRHTLWRDDARGRRRLTLAERERAWRSTLPGTACGGDRSQTGTRPRASRHEQPDGDDGRDGRPRMSRDHPGRSPAKIRTGFRISGVIPAKAGIHDHGSCKFWHRQRIWIPAYAGMTMLRFWRIMPTALPDHLTPSGRAVVDAHSPNLFDFGKPFGGRRPASVRSPIQSRRSSFATVQVRPDVSFQVSPSFNVKTLASETPPSL